jgi:hypothetical protein
LATSRKRVIIGCLLAAAAAGILAGSLILVSSTRSFDRSYALGYAHLAVLPNTIDLVRESADGWHFVTIHFRASADTVKAWLRASPALRSRNPVVDASGDAFYPCDHQLPPDADPDTEEGDCTTVRVSQDGRLVTIHLVIPSSATPVR